MKELEISFADDDPQIDISFAEYELQDDTKFTVATVTVIGQGTSAEFTFTSQEQSSLLSSVLTEVGVALDLTNNQGYSLQEATDHLEGYSTPDETDWGIQDIIGET